MAKKGKSDGTAKPPDATGFKHNPFAALAAQRPAASPVAPAHPEAKAAPPEPTATAPAAARPASPDKPAKSRGRLVLRRETKHRGGKAVIIVRGFAALREFDEAKVAELAKELKQKLGCGGTVEDGDGETEIVLQGDRAAKVADLLRAQGFRVDGVTS